jgi:hypothetical protein
MLWNGIGTPSLASADVEVEVLVQAEGLELREGVGLDVAGE